MAKETGNAGQPVEYLVNSVSALQFKDATFCLLFAKIFTMNQC